MEREPASSWYRQQVRQALRFGVRATVVGIVALAWPLVLSLIFGNALATLIFYGVACIADAGLFVLWLKRAFAYSKRASRGETFTLYPAARTRGISPKN